MDGDLVARLRAAADWGDAPWWWDSPEKTFGSEVGSPASLLAEAADQLTRRAAPSGVDALDVQESGGLAGIWLTPASENQEPVISLELVAGPKRYARIWLNNPNHVDWGWVLNDNAICIWQAAEPQV